MNGDTTGTGMIGYNVKATMDVMHTLVDNYAKLAETISTEWGSLKAMFRAEWVGPDEVAYEAQTAADICKVYANCKTAVEGMVKNITALLEDWREFQKKNILTGEGAASTEGQYATGEAFANITPPTVPETNLSETVNVGEQPVFSLDTKMGLVSGEQSADNIYRQFDEFIRVVYEGVKGLYEEIDTSQAFLGDKVKNAVDKSLDSLGEALALLSTSHKSLYENLENLIKKYTAEEVALSTATESMITEEDMSSLRTSSLGNGNATRGSGTDSGATE